MSTTALYERLSNVNVCFRGMFDTSGKTLLYRMPEKVTVWNGISIIWHLALRVSID